MPRNNEIVTERIKNGQCPICGKVTEGKSTLVLDPTFGEVWICGKHMVQGTNVLREEDVPCAQDTKSSGAPAATTEKSTE